MRQRIIQNTLVGKICFTLVDDMLEQIKFVEDSCICSATSKQATVVKIMQYFSVPTVDLKPIVFKAHGSDFQNRVWVASRQIKAGCTLTYGQLSDQMGSSPRAVAQALRHNPLPIVIPCHRVVAKTGLGGFVGQTHGPMLHIKRTLLRHEGVNFD